MENKKIATVIWAREVKLDQFLAKELGSEVIVSYKKKIGSFNLPVVFRYLFQSIHTYRSLKVSNPDIVLVMNPPIVAPLVVYIYCIFNKARFIIDTHTAAFLDSKWRFFHFLFRFLAKRAVLNTVHNFKNLEIIEEWKVGNGYVLSFYNPQKEELLTKNEVGFCNDIEIALKSDRKKVLMVNRFASDDAWEEVIKTAKLIPGMLFFITGDHQKAYLDKKTIPANVILTGYLEHEKFISLMDHSDVILALTKRKDTVLWSVREIMALKKPFVVTDSEVLRKYYGEVGIFTSMQPADMKEKILEGLENKLQIKEKIDKFLEKDRLRWQEDIQYLKDVINK